MTDTPKYRCEGCGRWLDEKDVADNGHPVPDAAGNPTPCGPVHRVEEQPTYGGLKADDWRGVLTALLSELSDLSANERALLDALNRIEKLEAERDELLEALSCLANHATRVRLSADNSQAELDKLHTALEEAARVVANCDKETNS